MSRIRSWMVAEVLGIATLAGLIGAIMASRAPAQPMARPGITEAEFKALYRDLHPKSERWANIPWRVSVSEARAAAAMARKPIFMIVNTGNCLGFV